MKQVLKWLYDHKVAITGFIALGLNYLDLLFNISDHLNIGEQWYFTIATLFYFVIGFAIKSNDIDNIELLEEIQKQNDILSHNEEIIDQLKDLLVNQSKEPINEETINKICNGHKQKKQNIDDTS